MKTQSQPAASKLLKRFDNELKDILMADLKVFKEKSQFISNKQPAQQQKAA